MPAKLLIIDLVGLTPRVLERMPRLASLFAGNAPVSLTPPLPAVTATSQATITTGRLPGEHGIVSNGWYFRESAEIRFWMRSDRLVYGEKIWETAKRIDPECRIANLFWRYGTHALCDLTVTERPVYRANGRKSGDVYCTPPKIRDELVERLGEFPLFRFWGPATSILSTRWIADATDHVMRTSDPHLTLTYLPHLDYDLQKFGPESEQAARAIQDVEEVATNLVEKAQNLGREVAVISEYGITAVTQPVYLNRLLRENGFLSVHDAQNGELLEAGASRAFAACSHQIAHVYVANPRDVDSVKRLLESASGVNRVLGTEEKKAAGIDHSRAGELVAVAEKKAWFAYPYWLDDARAPDFARCVAIHDKPGHDPVEMFLGPSGKGRVLRRLLQSRMGLRVPFDVVSLDANLIRGSHGRKPDNRDDGPVLLTSWPVPADSPVPMQDLKSLFLDCLFDPRKQSD